MPPSACSNRPRRRACAPVNAPFSWPNSSLASTPSANAPQLSATNGPPARGLASCTARAASSLPVPVSPSMSTGTSVRATRCRRRTSSFIAGLSPTTVRRRPAARRRTTSSCSARISGKPSMSSFTSRMNRGCTEGTNAGGITCSMRAGKRPASTMITHTVCICGVPAERHTSSGSAGRPSVTPWSAAKIWPWSEGSVIGRIRRSAAGPRAMISATSRRAGGSPIGEVKSRTCRCSTSVSSSSRSTGPRSGSPWRVAGSPRAVTVRSDQVSRQRGMVRNAPAMVRDAP